MAELKPLYIAANDDLRIVLDGPTIAVLGSAGIPPRSVPLRLVSRLVVMGEPRMSVSVLMACMESGIPVSIFARDGALRGCCLPGAGRKAERNDLLHDLIATPGWRERYDDWLRSAQRRAQSEALARMGEDRAQPSADAAHFAIVRAILRSASRPREQSFPLLKAVRFRLERLLAAHVPALLSGAGVAPRFQGWRGIPLDLRADMSRILAWYLWWPAAGLVAQFAAARAKFRRHHAVERTIVRQYEAHAPMIEHRFRRLVAEIDGLLYGFLP